VLEDEQDESGIAKIAGQSRETRSQRLAMEHCQPHQRQRGDGAPFQGGGKGVA
jgi:hypothetical protein